MKNIYALLCCVLVFFTLSGNAQCPTCVPDESCTSGDGLPAVCPLLPPDATAGVYYEEQITFYMPTTITDPGSGFEATLIDVTLASVSGLPFGLQFTLNDEDGVFHPSEGDNYGCATICGIPLLPGTYDIVITVNALVTVFGFEAEQSQSFVSTLLVIPGEGTANSFSYDNIAGCGSVEVNYEALISVPAPSVTTYQWEFGDGSTGEGATPPTVLYGAPGEYVAQLTTIVSDFTLQSVAVSNVGGGWDDFEEAFSDADPFFNVIDGNGNTVYSSSIIDNSNSNTWGGLGLVLSATPYSIQFFDDDLLNDDDMGTTTIELTSGENFFDIGNGTVGTITIELTVTTEITDEATITVFDSPNATIVQSGNILSLENTNVETVIWYRNGVAMDGEFETSLTMVQGGQYYAVVTNSFGCASTSDTILYCPDVSVQYDDSSQEVFVEDIYASYQWFYNGLPLDGADNFYYTVDVSGNYSVEVTTDYGCENASDVFILDLGIGEAVNRPITVYPNPAADVLYFNAGSGNISSVIVYDVVGKVVFNSAFNNRNTNSSIDVSGLLPGVYFTMIDGKRIRWVKK